MMDTVYMYGYQKPASLLTLAELNKRWQWFMLHPEFRNRLIAMFDAAKKAGTDLGIGGGARSVSGQETLFLARHEQVLIGGCCKYNGKRYALRKGAAHAAPPFLSYHEEGAYEGFGVAADLIGDLNWMRLNCGRFGLKEFSVAGELWHVQPVELPNSRSKYNGEKLTMWPR
jgi:LAS superfamily LD-carboxypeptidase LdcB